MKELTDDQLVAAFLESVKGYSGREIERMVPGVTQSDVSRWNRGRFKSLTASKRRALLHYLRSGAGDVRPSAMVREATASYGTEAGELTPPNYEGLGIEIPERNRLMPRPRALFDRFVHQLIDMGLGREDIEYWGRTVLAPIAHMNTLHRGKDVSDATTEEEQTWIVEGNVENALRIIRNRRG